MKIDEAIALMRLHGIPEDDIDSIMNAVIKLVFERVNMRIPSLAEELREIMREAPN